MKVYTYNIPDEVRFDVLRREAEHYLTPAGFLPATEASNARLHITIRADTAQNEEYSLERCVQKGGSGVTIHADGVRGAAHGFHHVLRLLGFGFSFFADARPRQIALSWPAPGNRFEVRPEFATRGFLAWNNFLNSPTTWNVSDYRQHLLTLWRWGGNTAVFRSDDWEPLAALRDGKGQWRLGKPMATTMDGPWGGVKDVKVSEFAYGTGKCFKDAVADAWGAANRFEKDPIATAQAEFASVCTFGCEIGVDVGFGFELRGDPTTPGAKDLVRRRIAHILKTYRDLQILSIIQCEAYGQRGWQTWAASPGYADIHRKHAYAFRYLDRVPARVAEGVRAAEWFQFIYRTAKEMRPSIRVVFPTWGGDRWMRGGDYWKGLHAILPEDAVLAQLDNIDPRSENTVSRATEGIGATRSLWTIPWIESDSSVLGRASQWHPQDDAGHMRSLARSAKQLGYSGLLGIHWQTAGVELNAGCLMSAGWNLRETTEAFHLRYARTFFTPQARRAAAVAGILQELENLGAGWSGTGQQVECESFSWDPFPPITTGPLTPGLRSLWKKLQEVRLEMFETPRTSFQVWMNYDALLFCFDQKRGNPESIEVLGFLRKRFAKLKLTTPHARRLLATMDFVLAYETIRRELATGGRLQRQQELLKETQSLGLKADARLLADYRRGLRRVEVTWRQLFSAQIARLDTRGDLGNLANMNIKAYQAWKQFRNERV